MQDSGQLLRYLHQGIDALLEQGGFDNGFDFRPTQKEALEAYKRFLHSNSLSDEEKLKGFFEIPTGVGKTAVFVGIVAAAHKAAEEDGEELKTVIVVPTTQLLTQTEEALNKFSPQLAGQIGLYGDGKKNLKLPITVMTYEAWFDLSEQGLIGSHNIDILISDEAHRGTSERRVDQMLGVFDARTLQLAFTATAHFDAEKSVENSHKREIYYKPMREAVQGGELSSYIQSQRAIIRVSPSKYMLTEDFANAAEAAQVKYRRRLKQKTWNEFALKTFREGRDERTQDLLSDNDAGFFVDGTVQADELEEMLNNDPVLQARALAKGKKGVAIAIHTKDMSKGEQRDRFKAYLRGDYMAVIGDEKFKEGFDYAPMKTLFDYHRNSVVDKVQILGRGARKWWNKLKERFEGLTVIDTVIYIGDEDPDTDEVTRKDALRSSISVKDVLEDSAIIGPDAIDFDVPRTGVGGYGTGPDIFDDNPDIEYVTNLEGIYQLDADILRLRKEHFIPFTDTMREELSSLFEKAKVSPTALAEQVTDWPHHMYPNLIIRWLNGRYDEIDPELHQAVSDRLNDVIEGRLEIKYDSTMADASRRQFDTNRIPLTDGMRKQLTQLIEDTGMAGTEILKRAKDDKPKAVTRSMISTWMREKGDKKAVKTVKKGEWDYVINLYKGTLADFKEKGLDPQKVEITPEQRAIFTKYNNAVGNPTLANHPDCPEDLKKSTIYCWITGDSTTAKKYHLDFAIKIWPKLVEAKLNGNNRKPTGPV